MPMYNEVLLTIPELIVHLRQSSFSSHWHCDDHGRVVAVRVGDTAPGAQEYCVACLIDWLGAHGMDLHDPYTEAAAEMFRIPRDEVTDEQRAYAKRRTYFLAYNGIDCPQDWMEGVLHFQVT